MPAQRELSMRQLRQLLRLHHRGLSAREIGRRMGVARSTIRNNLKRTAAAGLKWLLADEVTDDALEPGTAAVRARGRADGPATTLSMAPEIVPLFGAGKFRSWRVRRSAVGVISASVPWQSTAALQGRRYLACRRALPDADVFWQEIGMLAQAVAGALDLDDDGVVKKPVQQSRRNNGVAEDFTPLRKARAMAESW